MMQHVHLCSSKQLPGRVPNKAETPTFLSAISGALQIAEASRVLVYKVAINIRRFSNQL
jgi:hypothetical protein